MEFFTTFSFSVHLLRLPPATLFPARASHKSSFAIKCTIPLRTIATAYWGRERNAAALTNATPTASSNTAIFHKIRDARESKLERSFEMLGSQIIYQDGENFRLRCAPWCRRRRHGCQERAVSVRHTSVRSLACFERHITVCTFPEAG